MDTVRRIIAVVCAALFVPSGVLTLLAFNIESRAFDSAAYKQAFERQNLYEHLPGILAKALHSSTVQDLNADPYLRAMTEEDWQAALMLLLPPREIKAIADTALESILDYIYGGSDSVVISLLPLKRNLLGPAGMEATRQILKAQPDCTAEQLVQIGLGFVGGDVMLCNPPDEALGLMTPLIEAQVQIMALSIPDEVTLISSAQVSSRTDLRVRLNRVRTWMKITSVFPLLFLIGITVFGVRSIMDWFKWWGWPLLIAGAGSASVAVVGGPVFGYAVDRLLQNPDADFIPPILFSMMQETIHVMTDSILRPVLVEGLALTLLGVAMVSTAFLLIYRARPIR